MRGPALKPFYLIMLAACFAVSAALGLDWEKKLNALQAGPDILRAQAAGGTGEEEQDYTSRETRVETGTSQRIYREGNGLKAHYTFVNFDRDRLAADFGMTARDYKNYLAGYGYSEADMARLKAWREKARKFAWEKALLLGGKTAG